MNGLSLSTMCCALLRVCAVLGFCAVGACSDLSGENVAIPYSTIGCTCMSEADCIQSGCAPGGLCDDAQIAQCTTDADCGCGAQCVQLGQGGFVCRHLCDIGTPCPGQSICEDLSLASGVVMSACSPF
ncbi:MAG: hypothetical protein VX223_04770 [Myxococcota bacterium]|nr:hypothetical protein [Myxococcota bacterium]